MQTVLPLEIILQLVLPFTYQLRTHRREHHENLCQNKDEKNTIQSVLPDEVIIQHILPFAPQLGTTCRKYHEFLPKIPEEQKGNIKFPSVENRNPVYIKEGNITFEYEAKIDFKKLNKLIEHNDVKTLNISTHHPVFLEIKKMFEVILEMDRSVMEGWKYKNTFTIVQENHYDQNKNKKVQFVQMDWINSFVTSFIMYLYH